MFFIIDRSVINEVIKGDRNAKALFLDILTAIRNGSHLIRIDVEDIQNLLNAAKWDELNEGILKSYMQQAYQLISPVPGILEGRLIFWNEKLSPAEDIDRLRQNVSMKDLDATQYPDFKFFNPSQLWGEGWDDCAFFLKIGNAYKEFKNNSILIQFKLNPGGGATVGEYLKNSAANKHEMHLALCDNDKHYDDGHYGVTDYLNPTEDEQRNLGDTAKNLLNAFVSVDPLLVSIYIYKYTSELENLIPWDITASVYSDVFTKDIYQEFDKSFFDLKKGMKIKDLKNSPELLSYWLSVFNSNEELSKFLKKISEKYDSLKEAFESEANKSKKGKAEKKFHDFEGTEILKGKRTILKDIKDSAEKFESLGKKEIFDSLTQSQKSEWQNIGALVLTFGAAGTPFLN